MIKKAFVLLLSGCMMIAALGCEAQAPAETEPVAAETEVELVDDAEASIATIGDESVSFEDYKQAFDSYAGYYAMMGYDLTAESMLMEFQDFIVDMMVEEKIVTYQAGLAGFAEPDSAALSEAQKAAEEEIGMMMDAIREQAKLDLENDPTLNEEEHIAEMVADEAEYVTGIRMSEEEFTQWMAEHYAKSIMNDRFRESLLENVTVSDEEIQKWYDEKAAADREKYSATPGQYKIDKENEELYGEAPVIYAPEGYKRALHILIKPETSMPEQYTELQHAMDELGNEYGALAFEVQVLEKGEEKRLDEIADEYKMLEAEAEKLMAQHNAGSIAKAEEAYAKLQDGADFTAVMKEYGQSDTTRDEGELISNKHVIESDYAGEADWSNEVKSAFAPLSIGEYTGVVTDDAGCHILYYLEDVDEGNAPIEDVKERIRDLLLLDAQYAEWMEIMDIWKNDGSVKLNEELIRSVRYTG